MHSIKIKGKQPLTSKCSKTLLGATQELATHMVIISTYHVASKTKCDKFIFLEVSHTEQAKRISRNNGLVLLLPVE